MAFWNRDKDELNPITEDREIKRYRGKLLVIAPDGWGHITSEEIPFTKIFFHWTALNDNTPGLFKTLRKGMQVEFDYIENYQGQGPRAIKIELVEN